MDTNEKIPLPKFLQLFSSNGVPMSKALAITGKMFAQNADSYKEYNTPAALVRLTDVTLTTLGVEPKEDRKLVLTALKKAGYTSKNTPRKTVKMSPAATSQYQSPLLSPPKSPVSAGPSLIKSHSTPRKRKRPDSSNEYLPDGLSDSEEIAMNSISFDFNEVFDEEILKTKTAVINRAPVMMAWATLVAERMHFSKDEALSIASVYTEMNAISKGVSLGIYDKGKNRDADAQPGGSQPYVELMGRRPLYRTQTGHWRALNSGKPVPPTEAFSYISRSFRQTAPFFVGALRLLAESYSLQELRDKAWSLYAEFRPEVNEWGKRSQVHCKNILDLRKQSPVANQQELELEPEQQMPVVTIAEELSPISTSHDEPKHKKPRSLTVEEYEALLDEDTTFDNIDLNFVDNLP